MAWSFNLFRLNRDVKMYSSAFDQVLRANFNLLRRVEHLEQQLGIAKGRLGESNGRFAKLEKAKRRHGIIVGVRHGG